MLMDAAWNSLLGLPLEEALARVRAWGVEEPKVIVTQAPRRRQEESQGTPQGTLRVLRVKDGELTVSAFQDGWPRIE